MKQTFYDITEKRNVHLLPLLNSSIFLPLSRFSVLKLDDTDEFNFDLDLMLELEGTTTPITIMADTRVPIPLCNDNPLFTLPGDGSIAGFVRGLGQDISQIAIDIVLQELELKVSYALYVSVLSW